MTEADRERLLNNIEIRHHFKPGDVGRIVYLHGTLYAQEYGWDHTFETYVAVPLSEFVISHNDRERIWIVEKDGMVAGSIGIVEASRKEAQLRWLLLDRQLRGAGLGRRLVTEAVSFSRERDYELIFLWTEKRLEAATRLYREAGFQLVEEISHRRWGADVTEQKFELKLC